MSSDLECSLGAYVFINFERYSRKSETSGSLLLIVPCFKQTKPSLFTFSEEIFSIFKGTMTTQVVLNR